MSVLLYTNFDKKNALRGMNTIAWYELWQKHVGLFSIDTLKVSELFHMSSKIMQLLFSKSQILVNLLLRYIYLIDIGKTIILKKYFHWQSISPVWAISIFLFTLNYLSEYFQSNTGLILLIIYNLSGHLHVAFCLFLWLIKLKCVPYSSHHYDCFREWLYVILTGWKKWPWTRELLGRTKLERGLDLKGGEDLRIFFILWLLPP